MSTYGIPDQGGKVLYLTASSMFAWQFAKMFYTADRFGLSRFVTMQNHSASVTQSSMSMRRVDRRAQPSTIFAGTDTAARRSCDCSPKRSSLGMADVARYTSSTRAHPNV
jgi:hypothetical protein